MQKSLSTDIDAKSPPSRGAWIEIAWVEFLEVMKESPPSRGAWIEILSNGL